MKNILVLIFSALGIVGVKANYSLVKSPEEAVAALKKAGPGDTIALANGIYKDAVINFTANGLDEKPVVFICQQNGQVVFEGNSRLSFSGKYVVVDGFVWHNGGYDLEKSSVIEFRSSSKAEAEHCIVQNCVIDGFNNKDKTIDNKWVSIYGENNTVKNCLLRGKDNLGATLTVWLKEGQPPVHHTIEYNYFFQRINGPEADNGLESIRIGDSKTSMTDANCIVQYNLFEECDGEIEIISNKSGKNIYFGNTFYNCDGGLTLRHGNGAICEGNYFFGGRKEKSYGIRVIGENHIVRNNYFSGLKGFKDKFRAALTIVNGVENSPLNGYFQVKNLIVSGNQFVNCDGPAIRFGPGRSDALLAPVGIVMEKNIIFSTSKTPYSLIDYVAQPSKVESHSNFTNLKAKGYAGWETATLETRPNQWGILEISMDGKELSFSTKPMGENEVGPVWLRTND